MGDPWGVAGALEGLAGVLGAQGRDPLTARLLGFTGRLRQEIGAEIPTHERPRYERQLAHARAASPNEEAFQAALEEGRVMSLEEATELALAATDN
jgi:hypothetical protein